MTRRSIFVSLIPVALIGVLAWVVIRSREPSYQGKPLSIWLEGAHGEIHDLVEETVDTDSAKAIRAIGTAALPQLIRMVGTRDSSFRRMLMQLATDQPSLKIHIRPVKELQEEGACGFIVLGPTAKAALRPLISLLDDDDADVRKLAAFCLGKIKSGDAVPALTSVLDNKRAKKRGILRGPEEKYLAAYALGAIGPAARAALPHISALRNDTNWFVRESAEAAFIKISGEGLAPFLAALKDTSNWTNWVSATRIVGLVGTNASAAVPFLITGLQHTNHQVHEEALVALGRIHAQPQIAIPAIMSSLQSTNDFVRMHAVQAIGQFGSSAAGFVPISNVFRCLSDTSNLVRQNASNSLRRIAPEVAAKAGIQ
jgi:HEAT repeat protein